MKKDYLLVILNMKYNIIWYSLFPLKYLERDGVNDAFIRNAIESIVNLVASCTEHLIICGHVKDAKLDENTTGSLKTLDLTGKISRILSAKSDAIG